MTWIDSAGFDDLEDPTGEATPEEFAQEQITALLDCLDLSDCKSREDVFNVVYDELQEPHWFGVGREKSYVTAVTDAVWQSLLDKWADEVAEQAEIYSDAATPDAYSDSREVL